MRIRSHVSRFVPRGLAAALLVAALGVLAAARPADESVATFSIAAFDPQTGDLGVAVQSKFFSVGPVVPWVEAGVGAIATQAFANTTYGPRGLELLRLGLSPEQISSLLTSTDEQRDRRQLGIVDAKGSAFSYTGERCTPWAGGLTGKDPQGRAYAIQGNILAGEEVIRAMEHAFLSASGELADKLVAALAAGQQAGGDVRGQQSAALVVMRPKGGYAGMNDRYIDLRVEDHPSPITELARLLGVRHSFRHLAAAERAFREEKPAEAWQALEQALAAAPDYADVHYAVARFHARTGKSAEALKWLASAIERNPALRRAAAREASFESMRDTPAFQKLLTP